MSSRTFKRALIILKSILVNSGRSFEDDASPGAQTKRQLTKPKTAVRCHLVVRKLIMQERSPNNRCQVLLRSRCRVVATSLKNHD